MPRQTIRAYFGFQPPRHRRGHGSRSIWVVSGTAIIVVLLGLAFTLLHHNSKGSPTPSTLSLSGSSTTLAASSPTTSSSTPRHTATSTSTTTTTAPTATTTTLAGVSPSSVLVEVVNGSGTSGQASSVSTALQADGFRVNGTANASSYSFTSSVIDYPPGLLASAQTLARYINGSVVFHESSTIPSGEIQLTTGSSFTSVVSS